MKKGSRIWYLFRICEVGILAGCLLCLMLTQHLNAVYDDFTPAYPVKHSNDSSHFENRQGVSDCDEHCRRKSTRLSDFLIMYPCCTIIMLCLAMELTSVLLDDPLNKCSNMIFVLTCIILGMVIFLVSMLAALRTLYVTMIIASIFSALFVVLELVDFVFVLFS